MSVHVEGEELLDVQEVQNMEEGQTNNKITMGNGQQQQGNATGNNNDGQTAQNNDQLQGQGTSGGNNLNPQDDSFTVVSIRKAEAGSSDEDDEEDEEREEGEGTQ